MIDQYIAFFRTMLSMILSIVAGTIFLLTYIKTKKKLFVWCCLLFIFLFLDTFLLHMADILPGFSTFYNSQVDSEPLVRSILIMAYLISYRMILQYGVNFPIKRAGWGCISLLLVLIPATWLFPLTPFYGFLYNTATWSYTFYIFIAGILACGRCDYEEKTKRLIRFFLIVILVLEILAYIEVLVWIDTGTFYLDSRLSGLGQRRIFTDILGDLENVLGIWFGIYILKQAMEDKKTSAVSEKAAAVFAKSIKLTQRETEIFLLVLEQKRNQEIAELLHISLGTVKTHIHNIFAKADVENRGLLILKIAEKSGEMPGGQ